MKQSTLLVERSSKKFFFTKPFTNELFLTCVGIRYGIKIESEITSF